MHKKFIAFILIVGAALTLSGCLEDLQVTLHEPGVYMGPSDPLLEISNANALAERLSIGQTDR